MKAYAMRAWNRAKLLWGYARRQARLAALPVEYIVETTAKCNLYCPMCPRETLPQPKQDMDDAVFERLVEESASTAEHMMLIGLGEPFLDAKIFERIEHCRRRGVSTLLSTNGTLLTSELAERILSSGLEHITLSFDGATKETFEYYRKGARFEAVRDNFVRFARMKRERGAKIQIVVQMVRLEGNAGEVDAFRRFWRAVPGVDLVRVKEDETNLLRAGLVRPPAGAGRPCHYLWRGPMYVKHNGDVYACCQSYMLGGKPVGRVGEQSLEAMWNSRAMQEMRRLHAQGRAGDVDICSRCTIAIPHPALVVGSLLVHGRWVRRLLPLVETAARRLFTLPERAGAPDKLVQIQR